MEYSHPMLTRGRYQVVALSTEQVYDPGDTSGYAVLNSAGAKLRHELTLDEARAWLDKLAEEEEVSRSAAAHAPARPRRIRR